MAKEQKESNPVGRPPIWNNPDEFEKAVEMYFDFEPNPKWSGLAYFLGFESRKSLWEYGKKPEFSNSVKKALLRIEQHYEDNLLTKNATGAIFALKNFDWTDKQSIDHTTAGERITPPIRWTEK